MTQKPVDRDMLCVFRRAVYYASHRDHDPELLKWWNWKDGARRRWLARRRRGTALLWYHNPV